MNAAKLLASGTTAVLLAGGMFLGAPVAAAAPGDGACTQATAQFTGALNRAGITAGLVAEFDAAIAELTRLDARLAGLYAETNDLRLAFERAMIPYEAADIAYTTADDALVGLLRKKEELGSALTVKRDLVKGADDALKGAQAAYDELVAASPQDPDAIQAAKEAVDLSTGMLKRARDEEATAEAALKVVADAVPAADEAAGKAKIVFDEAEAAVEKAQEAWEAALDTPAIRETEAAWQAASMRLFALMETVKLDDAAAQELTRLFQAFLAACGPDAAPVSAAPAALPLAPAPAVNRGLNVQTAADSEPSGGAALVITSVLAGMAGLAGAAGLHRRATSRS